MQLIETIKTNPKLKKLVLRLLTPRNQARPRLWVRWFVNPFIHHYEKRSRVGRYARLDVFPFKEFSLGRDSVIEDFATINNGVGDVYIGKNVRVGLSNTIIGPVLIGDHVRLAQCITISALNHNYEDIDEVIDKQGVSTAQIIIKDNVWVGANAVILSGVTVGTHSVVGAGSVVTKNVPPYSVVGGNPAKLLKQYNTQTKTWERVKK